MLIENNEKYRRAGFIEQGLCLSLRKMRQEHARLEASVGHKVYSSQLGLHFAKCFLGTSHAGTQNSWSKGTQLMSELAADIHIILTLHEYKCKNYRKM